MSGSEVLQSVQFIEHRGKKLAILDAEDWEALIEWVESLEDMAAAREAIANLKAAHGDRAKAGWVDWETVKKDLR